MELATYIDHTILRADCTLDDIKKICEEAVQFKFPTVCVPPFYVKNAFDLLEEKPTKVCTVIGYPMGYSTTAAKIEEIKRAADDGASEVDFVINICAVKSGLWNYVQNDIDSAVTAAHLKGKVVKIILETSLLTEAEIQKLCEFCNEAKPDFVKTSTGLNGQGATVPIVEMLRNLLHDSIKIKASGGIRTREDAQNLIAAGARRIGTSAGAAIMQAF